MPGVTEPDGTAKGDKHKEVDDSWPPIFLTDVLCDLSPLFTVQLHQGTYNGSLIVVDMQCNFTKSTP